MPEHTGSGRPGGRTARTRRAVHDAVRALLSEPGADLSIPAVSARSGVHETTIYRRWRTIESLVLDVALERVSEESPVPATGDLRADLTSYVHQLLTALQQAGPRPPFLQALLRATAQAHEAADVTGIVQPRIRQFQAMLDAAGVTRIDGLRLFELVLAPAYLWAQLGAPLDPDAGTARLVDTVLCVARAAG
jgi:AcrR family transcriptional regulator